MARAKTGAVSEATWKDAEPPALPSATRVQKLRGVLRISVALVATLVLLLLFVIGKGIQAVLGPWVRFHYAVAKFWSRAMLAVFGIRPVVHGAPIRKGGILAANHASWLDILALRHVTRINFVAKAEVREWSGVGPVAALCETVFIERRRTEAKRQQEELLARIKADELLCVFPEGTSTDGLRVLPFKSALMSVLFVQGVHERALVQPVSIVYTPDPEAGLPVNFYGWWGSMPFEGHVWQIACRSRRGRVDVHFHEAMRAADWNDRKALTLRCEEAVRSAFPYEAPAVRDALTEDRSESLRT